MARLACYFVASTRPRILDTDQAPEGKSPWTVGRSPESQITFHKPTVSKAHALIRYFEEVRAWQLLDCGSLNGTFVNGERIAPSQWRNLMEGDTIDFGTIAARVRISFDDDETLHTIAEDETPTCNLKPALTPAVGPKPEPTVQQGAGDKSKMPWALAADALDWLQSPISLSGAMYRLLVLLAFLTAMVVVVIHK
ncbi:FHA domain-containing protein [Pseudanabaena sp. FACHB-2040]|uniref:FHA domain-containing protein n=1 Tax=Pseudanabaena sp. FACHB-2040 TaxID=2692859 RepID=UPI0016881965|nr:FHA domain-containing protein [Pseudanabaena sp. FACHB-2040]MBD2261388.1 FHA domain-containing protein [Pseudanabaena sp. FACHB-2040]